MTMALSHPLSVAVDRSAQPIINMEPKALSSGTFSADHRRHTAARFGRALQRNFASPAAVAKAWGVDPATAENWWNGHNQPLMWVAAKGMDTPELRPAIMDFFEGRA